MFAGVHKGPDLRVVRGSRFVSLRAPRPAAALPTPVRTQRVCIYTVQLGFVPILVRKLHCTVLDCGSLAHACALCFAETPPSDKY